MAGGDKAKYTDRRVRKAEHIEESCEERIEAGLIRSRRREPGARADRAEGA